MPNDEIIVNILLGRKSGKKGEEQSSLPLTLSYGKK